MKTLKLIVAALCLTLAVACTQTAQQAQNDNTNGTATGINGAEAEAQIVSIVNVNGAKVNSLQKGINIVTYSNGKRVKIMK